MPGLSTHSEAIRIFPIVIRENVTLLCTEYYFLDADRSIPSKTLSSSYYLKIRWPLICVATIEKLHDINAGEV